MPKESPPDYLALVTYKVAGQNRSGSAVLLDERRLITCYHVVRHRDDPGPVKSVKVALGGGKPVRAKTGPFDNELDLAILELPEPVTAAPRPWRRLDLHKGVPVVALGFPGGKFRKSEHEVFHVNDDRVQLEGDIGAGASGGAMECARHPHYYIGGLVFYETADKTGVIAYDRVEEFCQAHGIALPQAPPPPLAAKTYDREAYKARLREEVGFMDISEVIVGENLRYPSIDKLYIPSTTFLPRGVRGEEVHEKVTLDRAVSLHRIAVIQGEAGCGKSTFLKRIAYALVREEPERDISLDFQGLPLWLPLTQLEAFLQRSRPETLPAQEDDPRAIALCLADLPAMQGLGLDAPFFERELDNPRSILLLDGLDEGSSDQWRARMAKLILRACSRYRCHFAVTMRPEVERESRLLGNHPRFLILDMDDAAVEHFLRTWIAQLPPAAGCTPEEHVRLLRDNLASRPYIRRMARNPLMLTMLAALTREQRRLPEQRADLYKLVVEWLAKTRHADRTQINRLLSTLSYLALRMTERETGKYLISELEAAGLLAVCFDPPPPTTPVEAARDYLVNAREKSGIVTERGGKLAFWHRSFQEYLAARRLALGEEGAERVRLVWNMIQLRQSPEVPRLVAGCMQPEAGEVLGALFEKLIAKAAKQTIEPRAYSVGILANMLRDLEPSHYKLPRTVREAYDKLLASVMSIFEDPKVAARVPVADRVAVAEALAAAGDPRLHPPSDPRYWVRIEGGTFRMGAQAKDPNAANYDKEAYDDEPVSKPLHVTAFEIGKYPVTVQEYQAYLDANGVEPDAKWRKEKRWEDQLPHPSRPVVRLSWNEADAYCRAIGGSLPSEAQWEFAARGSEQRRYAWGNDRPTANHANFGETGIRDVCPVGLFPAGSTPQGVCDLAGNVWEWTSGDYDARYKALRGASCHSDARYLRASVRDFVGVDSYAGFRCVREALPPDP